jgi:hypothetical protein
MYFCIYNLPICIFIALDFFQSYDLSHHTLHLGKAYQLDSIFSFVGGKIGLLPDGLSRLVGAANCFENYSFCNIKRKIK